MSFPRIFLFLLSPLLCQLKAQNVNSSLTSAIMTAIETSAPLRWKQKLLIRKKQKKKRIQQVECQEIVKLSRGMKTFTLPSFLEHNLNVVTQQGLGRFLIRNLKSFKSMIKVFLVKLWDERLSKMWSPALILGHHSQMIPNFSVKAAKKQQSWVHLMPWMKNLSELSANRGVGKEEKNCDNNTTRTLLSFTFRPVRLP